MSTRPTPKTIESGVEGWDALHNDNVELWADRPFPIAEHTGDESDIEATFPADEYRNCTIWVNHTSLGWTRYKSDGTTWDIDGGATDSDAFHKTGTGEIAALTSIGSPTGGESVLVEDDTAGDAKRRIAVSALGGGGGVTDHGALTGLADDDHTQYLLADGTRAMSGALDMGGGAISNVGNVDGRDVSADGTKLDGIEAGATADQSNAEIETAYNAQVPAVTQATAEAGTDTTVRRWTAERVAQAIAALGGSGGPTTADELPFVPAGNIAATDVQAAIQELDTEKAPAAEGVTNGNSHDHNGGDGGQIAHANLSGIGSNTHAQIDSHIAATAAHGATGAVMGTTNTQTFSNKKGTLAAGTATAGTAPLKLTSGTNLTTPEAGALEFDGNDLYFTIGSQRLRVGYQTGFNVGALRIVDMGLNTAPGSPSANDTHVIGTSQTGSTAWTSITGGNVVKRDWSNTAWIDMGAPKDGWRGRVTVSATHHFKGAHVGYAAGAALWHPLRDLWITTAHWTGGFTQSGNQEWSKSFTQALTDNSGATSDNDNFTHGLSISTSDPHVYAYGSISNGATRVQVPQNFSGIPFEVKVLGSVVQMTFDANLSAYTADIRIIYVPA